MTETSDLPAFGAPDATGTQSPANEVRSTSCCAYAGVTPATSGCTQLCTNRTGTRGRDGSTR